MNLVENSVWNFDVNGKPALNALGELETKLGDLKKAQSELTRGTKEWADNKAEIKELENQIVKVREEFGTAGMTVRQLEQYVKLLNKELKDLTPGTDDYIKKTEELRDVNTRLASVRADVKAVANEVDNTKGTWDNLKDWMTGALAAFSLVNIIESVINFTRESMKMALETTDAFAKIGKATSMTKEEVEGLNKEIAEIDTRTAQKSLQDIAVVGGQIGVAKDEMLGFVESVDKAVVALGDEFTGGAEEVAQKMGVLKGLFKETKDLDAGQAINDIGSAINSLGASGSATGPVIADFTTRVGQLGDLAPEISQTLGLGAAFQEMGLSAEISAGGVSNILLTASKSTEVFAEHLKMTDAEFKNLINTNPNEVLLKLAESFRGMPIDVVVKQLDNLDIKSQEAVKVMSLLSNQTEVVKEKQELASKAMAEGTSLTEEFNIVNNTAAAIAEKQEKAVDALKVQLGTGLLPVLLAVTTGAISFVKVIAAIPEFVEENKEMFTALGVAILAFNGHLIVATANSLLHAAAEKARLIWTESATVAQLAMNTAMTANPIGVVVAAIALFVAGIIALYEHSEIFRGIINGVWAAVKTGIDILFDAGKAVASLGGFFEACWDKIVKFGESIGTAIKPGLDAMKSGFELVKDAVASFIGMIETGISKVTGFLRSITPSGFTDAVKTFTDAGKKIAESFNSAFDAEQSKGHAQQSAADKAHLDGKVVGQKKTAEQIAADQIEQEKKAREDKSKGEEAARQSKLYAEKQAKAAELEDKAKENERHRKSEEAKAKAAAEKEAADKVKAEKEAIKLIEDASIKAIKDDQARELAKLSLSYVREVERVNQSKASQTTKAAWERALYEQLERDQDKVATEYRNKKIAEEKKRVAEINKLEEQQRNERQSKEFSTQKLILETQLKNEKLSINQRQALKLQLIDLERKQELARIEEVAAKERAKALETSNQLMKLAGDDAAKKKAIENETAATLRSIDNNRIAQTNAANAAHQQAMKANEAAALAERKANQTAYFDACKMLMNGDFSGFMDILNKKLANEKAANNENLQNFSKTGSEILGVARTGMDMLLSMSQNRTQKELASIENEKQAQIKSWTEKYEKGLISKDEYEAGIEAANKQAHAKEYEEKLKAWKREQKMNIGMALINAAMAALKSLATMGFPLGLIGVAGSAVAAAIQIKAIKSQAPPSFAQGGYIRNAGVPSGSRHGLRYGDSGISLTDRKTGQEVGEMEGDEPIMILSRNTYANNRVMINALLDSSLHRNGAPIHAAKGTVFGSDGGDYRQLLEPLKYGEKYLFGSKKRKMEAEAEMQRIAMEQDAKKQQEEADREMAAAQAQADAMLADTGGGYDGGGYSDGMAESSAAGASTNEQINRSQMMMEKIGRNTAATVDALIEVKNVMIGVSGKIDSLIGATNRAADGSFAAASAGNRAADAAAMSAKNDL